MSWTGRRTAAGRTGTRRSPTNGHRLASILIRGKQRLEGGRVAASTRSPINAVNGSPGCAAAGTASHGGINAASTGSLPFPCDVNRIAGTPGLFGPPMPDGKLSRSRRNLLTLDTFCCGDRTKMELRVGGAFVEHYRRRHERRCLFAGTGTIPRGLSATWARRGAREPRQNHQGSRRCCIVPMAAESLAAAGYEPGCRAPCLRVGCRARGGGDRSAGRRACLRG